MRKIAEYSMPVYKIAAGMIVLLSISYFINMKFFPASHDRIVFLTDTIYKEILVPESIWLADSSTREQYFHVNFKENLQKKNDYDNLNSFESDLKESDYEDYSESAIMARHVGLVSDRDIINFRKKQNKGKNLHEDSMLRQFLVVVP